MVYNNLNLPATLVHSVNGKKYTLNGKMLSINESTKTCTMQFGDKIGENIPLKEIYLTESALTDYIKKAGKKIKNATIEVWNKIKGIAKSIGGFLLAIDENGEGIIRFLNSPLNLALMKLPKMVKFAPAESSYEIYDELDAKVINDCTIDDAFEGLLKNEKEEIETYWGRVMKEYAKNESMSISDTIKMVNETYYTPFDKKLKPLNEVVASLESPNENIYGRSLNTQELVGAIKSNIKFQITRDLFGKQNARPLLIWGAPGIGKTAIIKQAAKLVLKKYKLKLDMTTVACAGIQVDDFELPDTVINKVGQKLAISTPRTWLPVYSTDGLTEEQIAITDEYYNTGQFRIRDFISDKLANREITSEEGNTGKMISFDNSLGNVKRYDGGIVFFDELGRLGNVKTLETMMDIADRHYKGMQLASRWCTLFASNRLLDDNKSEFDPDAYNMWAEATKNRFTHYTYVPTKEEWLTWAREIDEEGPNAVGYQHVDEMICKFIEAMPEGVWYDALAFKSRGQIADPKKDQKLSDALEKLKEGSELTLDEVKAISSFVSTPGKSLDALSKLTWNGRTWDQKIAKPFMSKLKDDLFVGEPEKFDACFSETQRVRSLYGGYSSETYRAKNLDFVKLKEQLDTIPNEEWYDWCGEQYKTIDPSGELRKNNRLGFVIGLIAEMIRNETGKNSLPYTSWKDYQNIDSIFKQEDIKAIYLKGDLKSATSRRDDNILLDDMAQYRQIPTVAWKSNMDTVDKVVSKVLDSFDMFIDKKRILIDLKNIEKNMSKPVTPDEINRYSEQYTLHFTDMKGKQIKNVKTLFNESLPYDKEDESKIVHILKNSETAQKLANLAMWLSKISIEIKQNTPIVAALGIQGQIADGTIAKRLGDMIKDEQAAIDFYDNHNLNDYSLILPAMHILEAMRQYALI